MSQYKKINWEREKGGVVSIPFSLTFAPSPRLSRLSVLVTNISLGSQVYPQVMHRLCQSLYSGELNYQYTDTLHQICLMCYYSAQEHITPLMELIKSMHRLPHQIIRKIIVAVLPLAKLKSDFRNALILTLRKMLFSKDDYIKQTAVFGFLQVIFFVPNFFLFLSLSLCLLNERSEAEVMTRRFSRYFVCFAFDKTLQI